MADDQICTVVDDNGYYSHKLAWHDESGNIRTHKYDAIIGSAQEAQTGLHGGLVDMYETEDGQRFTCNAFVTPVAIRNQNYGESVENRILVNHGLVKAGMAGKKVRLATALPMRDFYSHDGHQNQRLIDGQAANMRKPVYQAFDSSRNEEPVAEIVESRVLSEGVSAIIDYLIDDDGQELFDLQDINAPMAVLDFGGSTFDVVSMAPNLAIMQNSSGTIQRGTLDIKEKFATLLPDYLAKKGHKVHKPANWMIAQAFERGYIRMHSSDGVSDVDVSDLLVKAAEPVVNEIKQFAKSTLNDMTSYQFILLVGGGSLLCGALFKDWMEDYSLILRDEFANARGMLKFITHLPGGQ